MIDDIIWAIYGHIIALENQIKTGNIDCNKHSKEILHELSPRLLTCLNLIPK